MPKVKVTRRSHTRVERSPGGRKNVRYNVGDTFTATDRELKAFSDRLEKVGGAETAEPAKPAPTKSKMKDEAGKVDKDAERTGDDSGEAGSK